MPATRPVYRSHRRSTRRRGRAGCTGRPGRPAGSRADPSATATTRSPEQDDGSGTSRILEVIRLGVGLVGKAVVFERTPAADELTATTWTPLEVAPRVVQPAARSAAISTARPRPQLRNPVREPRLTG